MLGMGMAGSWLGVYRLDPHQAHQPLYPLSADVYALTLKLATNRPAPGRGGGQGTIRRFFASGPDHPVS